MYHTSNEFWDFPYAIIIIIVIRRVVTIKATIYIQIYRILYVTI